MSPEELVDETFEIYEEWFETIPQDQHAKILVGIFAKRITDQTILIEYLNKRLHYYEKKNG